MAEHAVRSGGLVGRDRELAYLRRAVHDAVAGHGGLVLVSGEPGIGKTCLVAEAVASAAAAGARTGWGRCFADAPAYWPWRQLFRAVAPGDEAIAAALGQAGSPADNGARFRLFESVTDRLHALTGDQALVLALDDLQWADVASLRLLAFLGRSLHDRPLLVLGTYRDVEVGDDHPLTGLTGELGGGVSVVALDGLGVEGVTRLMAEHAGEVGPDVVTTVHARTNGNPFFVREVAHPLGTSGVRGTWTVPPAIGEVIGRQLAGCSQPCIELLAAAAVVGSASDLRLLAGVLGCGAPDLIGPAEQARRRRLLEPAAGGYRFRHDLVREAVLDRMPPRQRAELHWAAGEALESTGRADRLQEAARHLEAGVVAGDAARAATVALRAAREAVSVLAYEQAVDHLEWVLERAATGITLPLDSDELELLLLLGEARLRAGDWEGAGNAFDRAAGLARATHRVEELGRAALGFGAGLGGFEVRLRDVRQIALLEEAATALAGTDSVVGAFVLARLSVALSSVDEPGRREELARAALAAADRTVDAAARAYALAAWCDVIAGPAHTEQRLQAAEKIIDLGHDAGNDELVLLGHRFGVVAHLELGNLAGAEREIRAFERVAQRYRLPIVRWYVPLWRGMQALLRGDLDSAERCARQAHDIGSGAGSDNASMLAGTLELVTAWTRRAIPRDMAALVRALSESILAEHPGTCWARANLLVLAGVAGDLREVRRHLDAMVALGFGECDAEWLGTLETVAEACLALGDADVAGLVADLLEPYEQRFVVHGIGSAVTGSVGELLGVLDLLRGRRQQGEARLRTAIERYEQLGAPLLAQRARAHLSIEPQPATAPAGRGLSRRAVTAGNRAVAQPAEGREPSAPNRFRLEGAVWTLSFAGQTVRLSDAKGLQDLARLLGCPGREVHCTELMGAAVEQSDAGPLLDAEARRRYEARIVDLQGDLVEAEDANDWGRAEKARLEMDLLVEQLAAASGLGGRSRRTGGTAERARSAVSWRIRAAIKRIADAHPPLGRHLQQSVRTGSWCAYQPEDDLAWDL